MSTVVLENEQLKAVFSRRTGALLELQNKTTLWSIQRRPELALSFRLQVPLPARHANRVQGLDQPVAELEVSPDGQRLDCTWRDLQSEHGGPLEITFRATVTLAGAALTFEAAIENHSPYPVEAVSYPCLGDLSQSAPERPLVCLKQGYAGMDKIPLLPHFAGRMGYYGFDYPFEMVPSPDTPFVLLDGGSEGLYAASHDPSLKESVQFAFEVKPGFERMDDTGHGLVAPESVDGRASHLEFCVVHFPFALPGESASLSPVVLAPYAGSWQRGADVYKAWRATWFTPPRTPEWARDVHAWQQFQINSSEDEIRCGYKDLIQVGEECARHGIAAIQLVGWNNGGQDRGNPSHDTDPRLGTWDDLREAIATIQALGVHVILFSKYTWADRDNENFKTELIRYVTKDPYGDTHYHQGYDYHTLTQLAGINTRRFSPMCPLGAEWRQAAAREFHKTIDLGAAGMLFDECQHHAGVRYCFDPEHGHHRPAHVYAGDALLAEDFRAITEREAPEFLFSGEACYDLEYRHYSISYFRIARDHQPWERYVDPFAGIMAATIGFNDRDKINQCLMFRYIISYEPLNFKGRLAEMPRTLQYGKRVDALRRRYRQYIWDGEYRDRLEARVTAGGKPSHEYSVFRAAATGKHAAVVLNREAQASLAVTVGFESGSASMLLATPEQPEARPSGPSFEIPPLSAVLVMEA